MKKLMIMALFASCLWSADQTSWVMDKPTFSEFDLNNDGKITQSELEEAREKRMKKRADEGRMLRKAGEAHSFTQIDINKDGSISEKEFILHQRIQHNQGCVTFG